MIIIVNANVSIIYACKVIQQYNVITFKTFIKIF